MLAEHGDTEARKKLAKQLMEPLPPSVLRPRQAKTAAQAADRSGFMSAMHGAAGAP